MLFIFTHYYIPNVAFSNVLDIYSIHVIVAIAQTSLGMRRSRDWRPCCDDKGSVGMPGD